MLHYTDTKSEQNKHISGISEYISTYVVHTVLQCAFSRLMDRTLLHRIHKAVTQKNFIRFLLQ